MWLLGAWHHRAALLQPHAKQAWNMWEGAREERGGCCGLEVEVIVMAAGMGRRGCPGFASWWRSSARFLWRVQRAAPSPQDVGEQLVTAGVAEVYCPWMPSAQVRLGASAGRCGLGRSFLPCSRL